jgi:mycothiol system anti-sigma-R factor
MQNIYTDCNEEYNEHNCRETIKKVMLALDGELSAEEELRFMHDIKICSHCLEKYNIEKEFKLFLCSKVQKKNCTEDLKNKIRAQISRMRGDA